MTLLAALVVIVAGLAVGATSIGGVLVVPALTALANLPVAGAVAAASFGFAFTGAAAFIGARDQPGRSGVLGSSAVLDISALIGAALGALSLAWIPGAGIRWAVGLVAVASGLHALWGRTPSSTASPMALPSVALAGLGLLVGCGSAWSGTGGPVLLLPLLAWLRWRTDAAVQAAQRIQLPVALAASAVHFAAGRLDVLLGAGIGVLVLAGWLVGRRLVRHWPTRRLQQAVAVALIVAGLSYL